VVYGSLEILTLVAFLNGLNKKHSDDFEGKITDKEFITNVEYLQKSGVIRPR